MSKLIKKKAASTLLVTLLAFSTCLTGFSEAWANNSNDWSFDHTFTGQGHVSIDTPWRTKEDDSSSYVYTPWITADGALKATVYAVDEDGGWHNVFSPTYYLYNQYWRYLDNYVKENGNWPRALIRFEVSSLGNKPFGFRSYWSPDSI